MEARASENAPLLLRPPSRSYPVCLLQRPPAHASRARPTAPRFSRGWVTCAGAALLLESSLLKSGVAVECGGPLPSRRTFYRVAEKRWGLGVFLVGNFFG